MAPWSRKPEAASQAASSPADSRPVGASPGTSSASASAGARTLGRTDATIKPNIVFDTTNATQKKPASVVEMLEYVKGLDIDPIKEPDMLWIAEEAFNAPLPPGWTEHQDEQGRLYFYSTTTSESVWQHPMNDLFREMVDIQRRVGTFGGFFEIDDEIAKLEETIKTDLADWMELFDDQTEKFFYNKRTDESRFDDPRMAVYHNFYARIKMVAKMKERLPLLAQNSRPGVSDKEPPRLNQDGSVDESQDEVQKGPQPLKGQLRLRLADKDEGGYQEVVLAQTTPHRRNKAATKIQSRARGMIARKRFRPLVQHRRYLSKLVTKLQVMARMWLARRRVARIRLQRKENAATNIQRCFRGHRDRKFISSLRAERLRFLHMHKSVVVIQSGVRMKQGKRKVQKKRAGQKDEMALVLQSQARVHLARYALRDCLLAEEPVQVQFAFTTNPKASGLVPMSVQVGCAPWAADEKPAAYNERSVHERFVNLFGKVSAESYKELAAVRIQAAARGMLVRNKKKGRSKVGADVTRKIADSAATEDDAAAQKATEDKKAAEDAATAQKAAEDAAAAQKAAEDKKAAEEQMIESACGDQKTKAATVIQARWRGWLCRRHVEHLREETMWPIKSWFEFTSTGPDTVQMQVRFVPNPRFDDVKSFERYGRGSDLASGIKDMTEGVDVCVEKLLGSAGDEVREEARRNVQEDRQKEEAEDGPRRKEEAQRKFEEEKRQQSKKGASKEASPEATPQVRESSKNAAQTVATPVQDPVPARESSKRGSSPVPATTELAPPADAKEVATSERQKSKNAKATGEAQAKAQSKTAKPEPKAKAEAKAKAEPKVRTESKSPEPKARTSSKAPEPQAKAEAKAKASPEKAKPKSKGKAKAPEATASKTQSAAEEGSKTLLPSEMPQDSPSQAKTLKPSTAEREDRSNPAKTSKPSTAEEPVLPPVKPPTRKQKPVAPKEIKSNGSLFEMNNLASEAHKILKLAEYKYRDIPPEGSFIRPRPPDKTVAPEPPSPATRTPADAKASALKLSQSDGAIEGIKKEELGASGKRRTYGGTLVGKTFVRSNAENVDDMSQKEQESCLADINAMRSAKQQEMIVKAKFHKERKQQYQQAREEKYNSEMGAAEAVQEERRKAKVKELKKWLKVKEDQTRQRKEREENMINDVMQKEAAKSEDKKRIEEKRVEERERRLAVGERQKAKIKEQMDFARADRAEKRMSAAVSRDEPSSSRVASGYPQPMMEPSQFPGQAAAMMAAEQQRVVHRHIHHHVHYHEGNDEAEPAEELSGRDAGPPAVVSTEEQRQIEMASEARVRSQLEATGQAPPGGKSLSQHFHQHLGMPRGMSPVDPGAVTPTNQQMGRRAQSMGALPVDGQDRTQEAFYRPPQQGQLPASMPMPSKAPGSDLRDKAKRKGLHKYADNNQRAFSSYADCGRPNYARASAS